MQIWPDKLLSTNRSHAHVLTGITFMLLGSIVVFLEAKTNNPWPLTRYGLFFASFGFLSFGIWHGRRARGWSRGVGLTIALFLIWHVASLLRAIPVLLEGQYDYLYVKRLLSGGGLLVLIPFLITLEPSVELFAMLMRYGLRMVVLGCLLLPMLFQLYPNTPGYGIEVITRLFIASGSLILLTGYYQSRTVVSLVSMSFAASIAILLVLARRNMVVYFAAVVAFSVILELLNERRNLLITIVILLVLIFAISLLGYTFRDDLALAVDRFSSGFESRNTVFDEFISDFDNSPADWYVGRGLFGKYYSETTYSDANARSRDGIESGYLTYILIGGWIQLGLIILVLMPAAARGLFGSRNTLCRASGAIITVYFVDMIGYGLPDVHLKYVLVWLSAAACHSKELRRMTDVDIRRVISRVPMW